MFCKSSYTKCLMSVSHREIFVMLELYTALCNCNNTEYTIQLVFSLKLVKIIQLIHYRNFGDNTVFIDTEFSRSCIGKYKNKGTNLDCLKLP